MAKKPDISPAVRLLKMPQLTAAGYGSRATIYRRVREGKFPKPIKLGDSIVWREADIVAWLDKQATV